jgi:nucleotide-binding universal stress UspA family protein
MTLLEYGEQAQLIVVGSRGRGGFKGMLLGSTSQALVQHAPCPVPIVRPGEL